MKREAQINIAAIEYAENNDVLLPGMDLMEEAFQAGAQWADAHPNWISVEDRLPEEKQKVLVYMPADERCDHEYMCEALYNYAWHKWEDADEPIELEGVTHWMPIIPPRKEE